MPELPDISAYVHALEHRVVGATLDGIRIFSPFLLRSVSPAPAELIGKQVIAVSRLGKRIVFALDDDCFLVLHLMIAGRLAWSEKAIEKRPRGKAGLAVFEFSSGSVALTEAGTTKRASLHCAAGSDTLAAHDPGGIEPLECSVDDFREALLTENRTLKRALTNPKTFSGIGNAYSDEILHAARLSPVRLTRSLSHDEISRLHVATTETLSIWRDRLLSMFGERFPKPAEITAFRLEFAVHGKFGQPCPVCGSPVQRISYAENETNYCAKCQNEGRILADRALSRLLKDDWPKTIEDMVGG